EEPIGSMGNDFALAVLSDQSPPLYSYFKQLFAQVTNPAIDSIRERVVMSLETSVGPQSNLFTETPEHAHQLIIGQPILSNGELEKLRQVDHHVFHADTLDATWPREVHHMCCLLAYGASAVNPYLAFETLHDLFDRGRLAKVESAAEADANFVKSMGKGILKTISKMGISTVRSYSGAQIFEAVGLERELIDRYFAHTTSRIGGIGLDVLAREALDRHRRAFPLAGEMLPVGGVHMWRRDGEHHQWNPDSIAKLQHSVRHGGQEAYDEFTRMVNDESKRRATLRGLLKLREPGEPIPIEEVEPAKEIVKRFATGAMSLGSLSTEAHETLAIAMNRIGGKSNTGEGGEDPRRYEKEPNGDWKRSAIKQVASGRFGVTAHYLINADELQI